MLAGSHLRERELVCCIYLPVGTLRPLVLSFRLKNMLFSFSKLMDIVLKDMHGLYGRYLDDVAIFSDTWEDHITNLKSVFARVCDAGLTKKAKKCHFGCSHVTYLGHAVGQGSRRPSDIKIAPSTDFPQPRTKHKVHVFLRLQVLPEIHTKLFPNVKFPG